MTMSDAAQWIAKAEEDLRLVAHELVLPDEEIVTSGVCFHAQQAAEKEKRGQEPFPVHPAGQAGKETL